MKKLQLAYILFALVIVSSCKHEFEQPSWNTNFTAPIVHLELGLDNLDSEDFITLDTLSDNSLLLVLNEELISQSLDSVEISSVTTVKNVNLESINFSDTKIKHEITLGDLITSANIGLLIQNQSTSIIPGVSNVINDVIPVDANEYFESMMLSSGFLDLSITNNLPSDMTNISLSIQNEGETETILEMNIALLATGETATMTVPLDGMTLYGNLEINVTNADLVGTGTEPVLIDYQDALITEMTIRDIVLLEAFAVFPSQEIFNEDAEIALEIDDTELTRIIVKSGGVEITGASTMQDTLKITYEIPTAKLNGVPFSLFLAVPPAAPGQSTSITEFFDFSNYEIDLTGQNGDTINSLYTTSRGWIDSSGVITNISLDDSVYTSIEIKDIIPQVAYGKFSTDPIVGNEEIELDVFQELVGNFDLAKTEIKIVSENSIGANANLWIKSFESKKEIGSIFLNSSQIEGPFIISAATENSDPFLIPTASVNTILLDETNSNIDELIEYQPETFAINYEINVGSQTGFLSRYSKIESDLQISIPIEFSTAGITMIDTSDLEFEFPENLNEGSFTLIIENGYPFEVSIKLNLLDEAGLLIDNLVSNDKILAGQIGSNGKVSEQQVSSILFTFDNKDGRLENTKKIAFEAVLNTKPVNETIKIFSDYKVKLKLIANFNYKIEN